MYGATPKAQQRNDRKEEQMRKRHGTHTKIEREINGKFIPMRRSGTSGHLMTPILRHLIDEYGNSVIGIRQGDPLLS
jgi:hypothetical protein